MKCTGCSDIFNCFYFWIFLGWQSVW